MTRFVIDADVALHLARTALTIPSTHRLLAPTLLRSQVLALLYAAVKNGHLDRKAANRQLDYTRSLKMRLLGDRVLQRVAWDIASGLDWPDTYRAEYVALTLLQGDALVTFDSELAAAAGRIVHLASLDDLTGTAGGDDRGSRP